MSEAGYFDLQVNGYAGVDFNRDGVTPADFRRACDLLRQHGVNGILATVITAPLPSMRGRLAAIVAAREADEVVRAMIAGIHIEGPFLLPKEGYIGAHPLAAVLPATVADAQRLLDAAGGLTRIVTLAPECDADLAVTRFLAKQGIIVAAGHCDPALDQLRAALDAGLSMFTHLGNGCPALLHRHDNIAQRVLSLSDRLWVSFIADGFHVPPFALANYIRLAGLERCVVVTDAIAAAGLEPGRYTLGELEVEIGEDLVPRLPGTQLFAGSAATMPRLVEVLRDKVGLTRDQIDAVTCRNPRKLLQAAGLAVSDLL